MNVTIWRKLPDYYAFNGIVLMILIGLTVGKASVCMVYEILIDWRKFRPSLATTCRRLPGNKQVISADADGPRDAASRPIDHIALHILTQLDVQCIHQATASVDIDSTLLYTDRQLPAFSTYTRSGAQTPLDRFVVNMFNNKFATVHNKSNQRSLSLSV